MNNINPNSAEAHQLLLSGSLALCRAEQAGIRVDDLAAEKQKLYLTKKINQIETTFKTTDFYKEWIRSVGGKSVNINSHPQLSKFLYKVKGYTAKTNTTKGKDSTSEDSLLELGIPELNNLIEMRKLLKVRDTYLEAFIREAVDGYMHPSFALHLVKSFRSSANSPNFQNIPARDVEAMSICRGVLFPHEGHMLMESDFKSVEVAVNAAINKDPMLTKYVSDPTTDMHRDMAMQIFKLDTFDKKQDSHKTLRQAAKGAFVFAEFYGDYWRNVAENLTSNWCKLPKGKWKAGQGIPMPVGTISDHLIENGIKSFTAFEKHIQEVEQDFWGNRFKEYARWKDRFWASYQKRGYFDLPTGFRCSGLMDKKQVCNYPGQGSAFHVLLQSFILMDALIYRENLKSRLIGQIHDSMVLSVHPDEKEHIIKSIKHITTVQVPSEWPWIIVPLSVELKAGRINGPWSEMTEI